MKFAFVVNVEGATPETYSMVYETKKNYSKVVGVDGMEAAKGYVTKLASEGYELINLCGDFDDEITAEMQALVGESLKIKHADYSPAQLEKLNELESFENYGIIIIDDDTETLYEGSIKNNACKAQVIFVRDLEQAKVAGKTLVNNGVSFIELCSWFDGEKMEAVVEAVEGKVPVGTCGQL